MICLVDLGKAQASRITLKESQHRMIGPRATASQTRSRTIELGSAFQLFEYYDQKGGIAFL